MKISLYKKLLLLCLLPVLNLNAQQPDNNRSNESTWNAASANDDSDETLPFKPLQYHSHKGFEFRTADGKFLLQFASRLQFRFATPTDTDPSTFDDFQQGSKTAFKINRARLKIGGHAFQPWLNYYFEYELSQSNLLDFRVMIEKWEALSFKAGQWKADYNRERVISSGEQQMIERCIITRPFTLDRQQGIEVYGHLKSKGAVDLHYWLSVMTGTGRGATVNDDNNLMYIARLQWNPLGRAVSMSGSDIDISPKPALLIAFAGVTNQSPYTRFSQSGGGEMEGYNAGADGQYRVKQALFETAFKYKGFSWQHETHFKQVHDLVNNKITHLSGYYLQAGYFLHQALPAFPKQLELAALYAAYRPDTNIPQNRERQYSVTLNWFFAEHKNKLTAQFDHIIFDQPTVTAAGGDRFRLQWDISF